MNFFKNTKSYELVTIIEESRVIHKLKNAIIFIMKYYLYKFKMNRRIKKANPKDMIIIFEELFKEYYYLMDVLKGLNIEHDSSIFNSNIVNQNILSYIFYDLEDDMYIETNVEYNIYTNDISTSIKTRTITNTRISFNITERNLNNKNINSIFNDILNIFFNDILYIMIRVFTYYIK